MKTGKDIHTVGNKSSTGCVNLLCLGEEVFEPLGLFYVALLVVVLLLSCQVESVFLPLKMKNYINFSYALGCCIKLGNVVYKTRYIKRK